MAAFRVCMQFCVQNAPYRLFADLEESNQPVPLCLLCIRNMPYDPDLFGVMVIFAAEQSRTLLYFHNGFRREDAYLSLVSCAVLSAGALSVGTMKYGSVMQTAARERSEQFFELLFKHCYQMVMHKKEKVL